MKKIILLAIMLGLAGCGENGSSDVTSTTNNQSTELTSNNIQQTSARSISTYSMTVPFDGWHLFNPKALGASALYEGIKDALTSSAVLTADASQVAKVLGKGVAGYALSVAVEELLGAVDWVLDPANNQIKYYPPNAESDPAYQWVYNGVLYNSATAACRAFWNKIGSGWTLVSVDRPDREYPSCVGYNAEQNRYDANQPTQRVARIEPIEQKNLSLEIVAQKVIENADAGSLDAQVATMAAAAEKLADAANDEEIEQAIVDQLENNAKCPSGIMSEKGQCWECTKEDYPVITQRTKLAKVETARLGKCLPEMDNTALFIRINAFNEFVQARVNENSCWAPLDPGHVQQEQDGRNGALKCTNYLK